jgi:hypothetical protein
LVRNSNDEETNDFLHLATSGNDSIKTNIQRKREQLHLALEWNRVDIAKNYIMREERDWEVRVFNVVLEEFFSLSFFTRILI